MFLLDDHEIVRIGVRDLVNAEADMEVVGEVGSVASALGALRTVEADVALIDVRLGEDRDGIDACREIREQFPAVACIMLTSFDDDEARLHASEAGAAAFLLKQVRSNEIVETVRRVAAGSILLDSASIRMAKRRLEDDESSLVEQLTNRERQIFDLIGEGNTNRQIADALGVAEKTVKNYVTSMLLKLQIERRTEAAAMAARIDERRRKRFD